MAWKRERNDLQGKLQELMSSSEKYKAESSRQLANYKSKYQDYKTKLRKANQNIQTLASRVAKFEIQYGAERENIHMSEAKRRYQSAGSEGDEQLQQLNDIVNNPALNEEIRKLLAENYRH